MRKLNSKDVFAFSRLLKKAGIKEVLKNLQESAKDVKTEEELGFTLISSVLELISLNEGVEDDFYKFISRPLEIAPEEVSQMDFLKLLNSIKSLIELEDKEDWKAFLRSLASMNQ